MNKIIKGVIGFALCSCLTALMAAIKIEKILLGAVDEFPELHVQNVRKDILQRKVEFDMTIEGEKVYSVIQQSWFTNQITAEISSSRWNLGSSDIGYNKFLVSSKSISIQGLYFKSDEGPEGISIDMLEITPSNFEDFLQFLTITLDEKNGLEGVAEGVHSALLLNQKEGSSNESKADEQARLFARDKDLSINVRAKGVQFISTDSKKHPTKLSIDDLNIKRNLSLMLPNIDAKFISFQRDETDISLDHFSLQSSMTKSYLGPLSINAEYKNLFINQVSKDDAKYLMKTANIDFNQDLKGPYNMAVEVDVDSVANVIYMYMFKKPPLDGCNVKFKAAINNPVFVSKSEGSLLAKSIKSEGKFSEYRYHSETSIKNNQVWHEGLKFIKQALPLPKTSAYPMSVKSLALYIITDIGDYEQQTRDILYKLTYNSSKPKEIGIYVKDRIKAIDSSGEENLFSTDIEVPNMIHYLKAKLHNQKTLVHVYNGKVMDRRKASFQADQADLCYRFQSNNSAMIGAIGNIDHDEYSDPITYEVYQLGREAN